MIKFELLLDALEDFGWDNFVEVSKEVTKINPHNIQGELLQQAMVYSAYSGLQAKAKKRLDKARTELEIYEATSRKDKKETAVGKMTAQSLEDYVKASPDYRNHATAVRDARERYDYLASILNSLAHKKDMLVQLSANNRAEINLNN